MSPRGARSVRASINRTLATVADFPRVGRRQTLPGVRKIGTTKHPHLIYYRIEAVRDEIVVLTIRHGAGKPRYNDE